MLRLANLARGFAGVVTVLALTSAAASAQMVTRIETGKVVGGATLSVEKGVRVWRGLPPASVVVVNPGGRTPVTVNVNTAPIVADVGGGGGGGYAVAPVPRVGYGWGGGWGFGRYGAKRHHPGFIHVNGRPHRNGLFVPGRKSGGHHGGHR